jgi:hypothetical protein
MHTSKYPHLTWTFKVKVGLQLHFIHDTAMSYYDLDIEGQGDNDLIFIHYTLVISQYTGMQHVMEVGLKTRLSRQKTL